MTTEIERWFRADVRPADSSGPYYEKDFRLMVLNTGSFQNMRAQAAGLILAQGFECMKIVDDASKQEYL